VKKGRFAPSPTGVLHLGNLRTALAAWASAHANGGDFIIRFEDLDRITSSGDHALRQAEDLSAIGIRSDEIPVFQSARFDLYKVAIDSLTERGLTYECYCTRKEIAEAAAAPHGAVALYAGTCRDLSEEERAAKRAVRPPALRLRSSDVQCSFTDVLHGVVTGVTGDVVLRRNDGVPSYNVAVVVDDANQGITEVVRGDDLLMATPAQVLLQQLLGLPTPLYAHVPLVLSADGERLAKRHGAVTLYELEQQGMSPEDVRDMLWNSLGQTGDEFDWNAVPRDPWVPPLVHGKS
jgi:glutamyl-tRNA synthetase